MSSPSSASADSASSNNNNAASSFSTSSSDLTNVPAFPNQNNQNQNQNNQNQNNQNNQNYQNTDNTEIKRKITTSKNQISFSPTRKSITKGEDESSATTASKFGAKTTVMFNGPFLRSEAARTLRTGARVQKLRESRTEHDENQQPTPETTTSTPSISDFAPDLCDMIAGNASALASMYVKMFSDMFIVHPNAGANIRGTMTLNIEFFASSDETCEIQDDIKSPWLHLTQDIASIVTMHQNGDVETDAKMLKRLHRLHKQVFESGVLDRMAAIFVNDNKSDNSQFLSTEKFVRMVQFAIMRTMSMPQLPAPTVELFDTDLFRFTMRLASVVECYYGFDPKSTEYSYIHTLLHLRLLFFDPKVKDVEKITTAVIKILGDSIPLDSDAEFAAKIRNAMVSVGVFNYNVKKTSFSAVVRGIAPGAADPSSSILPAPNVTFSIEQAGAATMNISDVPRSVLRQVAAQGVTKFTIHGPSAYWNDKDVEAVVSKKVDNNVVVMLKERFDGIIPIISGAHCAPTLRKLAANTMKIVVFCNPEHNTSVLFIGVGARKEKLRMNATATIVKMTTIVGTTDANVPPPVSSTSPSSAAATSAAAAAAATTSTSATASATDNAATASATAAPKSDNTVTEDGVAAPAKPSRRTIRVDDASSFFTPVQEWRMTTIAATEETEIMNINNVRGVKLLHHNVKQGTKHFSVLFAGTEKDAASSFNKYLAIPLQKILRQTFSSRMITIKFNNDADNKRLTEEKKFDVGRFVCDNVPGAFGLVRYGELRICLPKRTTLSELAQFTAMTCTIARAIADEIINPKAILHKSATPAPKPRQDAALTATPKPTATTPEPEVVTTINVTTSSPLDPNELLSIVRKHALASKEPAESFAIDVVPNTDWKSFVVTTKKTLDAKIVEELTATGVEITTSLKAKPRPPTQNQQQQQNNNQQQSTESASSAAAASKENKNKNDENKNDENKNNNDENKTHGDGTNKEKEKESEKEIKTQISISLSIAAAKEGQKPRVPK